MHMRVPATRSLTQLRSTSANHQTQAVAMAATSRLAALMVATSRLAALIAATSNKLKARELHLALVVLPANLTHLRARTTKVNQALNQIQAALPVAPTVVNCLTMFAPVEADAATSVELENSRLQTITVTKPLPPSVQMTTLQVLTPRLSDGV
jgi:hypothetical protein